MIQCPQCDGALHKVAGKYKCFKCSFTQEEYKPDAKQLIPLVDIFHEYLLNGVVSQASFDRLDALYNEIHFEETHRSKDQ